jgi:hypothetical protein
MVFIGLVGTASRQQAKQVEHVKVELGGGLRERVDVDCFFYKKE